MKEFEQQSADGYYHAAVYLDDASRQNLFAPSLHRNLQGYQAREVMRRVLNEAPTDHPARRADRDL